MSKKTKYIINMRDGTTQEVEGEVVNKIWGIDKRGSDYHITHLPTGSHLPLGLFRTLKAAKLMLQEPEFFLDDLSKLPSAIHRFWETRGWKD